jgi:uncharacterized protein (TIGR03067 family)
MTRTTSVRAVCATVLALALGCAGPENQQSQAPSIEGSWLITSAMLGGQDMPTENLRATPLVLHAGNYTFQNDTGTYAIVPASDPAGIDVTGVHGPNAGKTMLAIFKLAGDTLTICYDLSGQERPKEFSAPAGTMTFLARYARSSL